MDLGALGLPPIFAAAGGLSVLDGPEHARLRALFVPAFAADRVAVLTPTLERIVDQLLDRVADQPLPVDLCEHLAHPLPVRVSCALLGLAPAAADRFAAATEEATRCFVRGFLERGVRVWQEMLRDLRQELQRKLAEPGPDLLTELTAGRGGSGVDTDTVLDLAARVLGAGHGTTSVQLGFGAVALLRNPEQLAVLREEPTLVPTAVEEILRFYPPVTSVGSPMRFAKVDTEVGGVRIPAGSLVLVSTHAASMCPQHFPEPETFDVRRTHNPHLAFGHGPHRCLADALARHTLRAAIDGLLRRFPKLELAIPVEDLRQTTYGVAIGFREIPVRW
ncbi:cytochrome P450 BJ-1 [Longimycelium tulufanense]|uniref:Cytochrome P450 BJ-1 n=1 Tax=Longimycelium tulufanense TaxID=907463 RepID=A0A8J3FXE8_9PSEU|nr:cytochrome P450 [Longimycelium tulufanense]GGM79095.1 cytochrome P450 BJ-1 [Longimycelium tulufanense]